MARPRKEKRNVELVRLREEEKWSFSKIGEFFNIKKHTAFDVYTREMARRELSPE